MKERYKKLLDCTLELEGLLTLALGKEEVSKELGELIDRKLSELILEDMEYHSALPEKPARKEEPAAVVVEHAFYSIDDDDEVEERTETSEPVVEKDEHTTNESPLPKRRKINFSLNDRFLFTRTLFGGNARAFDETIRELQECADFDRARNLLAEKGVTLRPDDSDDDERFLAAIREYFIL